MSASAAIPCAVTFDGQLKRYLPVLAGFAGILAILYGSVMILGTIFIGLPRDGVLSEAMIGLPFGLIPLVFGVGCFKINRMKESWMILLWMSSAVLTFITISWEALTRFLWKGFTFEAVGFGVFLLLLLPASLLTYREHHNNGASNK